MIGNYGTSCTHCKLEMKIPYGSLFLIMHEKAPDVIRFICIKFFTYNQQRATKNDIKLMCSKTPDSVKVIKDLDSDISEQEITEFMEKLN